MENDELNKKLLEFAGFKSVTYEDCWAPPTEHGKKHPKDICHYQYPGDSGDDAHGELPDLTQSIDACFKWLVPQYLAELSQQPTGFTDIMSVYAFLFAEWLKALQDETEPALALCKAIEKTIKED